MAPSQPAWVGSQTSGLAITSLVLGILGLLTACATLGLLSLLAVVFGHVGRAKIKRSRGALTGDGLATAGLVLGYIGLAVVALPILLLLLLGRGSVLAPFIYTLF